MMSLKERAVKLKRDIPTVFLCLNDNETPLPAKLMAAVTVAYALSRVDLIPDFVPVPEQLDGLIPVPSPRQYSCSPQTPGNETVYSRKIYGLTASQKSGTTPCR